MNIDEQLLNKNKDFDETEKAGEFRASLREQKQKEQTTATSFRQQVKEKKGLNITNEKRAAELIHRDSPLRKITDGFLKGAWRNLIPSWGLTLLYINAHAFLNQVFGPKAFRELGEEWIPSGLKKLGDAKGKKAVVLIKIIEKMGCLILNLLVIFLIIAILTIFAMIVAALTERFALVREMLSAGGFKDFIDFIKG